MMYNKRLSYAHTAKRLLRVFKTVILHVLAKFALNSNRIKFTH